MSTQDSTASTEATAPDVTAPEESSVEGAAPEGTEGMASDQRAAQRAESAPDTVAAPDIETEAHADTELAASGQDEEPSTGPQETDSTGTDAPEQNVTQVTQMSRQDDLVREGEVAADFLETLLDIADLDGDLEVDVEGNRAAVAIVDSEDGVAPRRLVGPSGSVLEALQELTRLAVQADTGERSRLMLDVAGYRADRRAALVKSAQRAIAEVKETGSRRELEPMTAFERKVIHDEVLAAGLHSESEGVEPSRYVVILPAH